jgi:hypothetical protein
MKKDDLIILLITLLLLAGMFVTFFFGGEKSRHGVGILIDDRAELQLSFSKSRKSKSETICPIGTYRIACLPFMEISAVPAHINRQENPAQKMCLEIIS